VERTFLSVVTNLNISFSLRDANPILTALNLFRKSGSTSNNTLCRAEYVASPRRPRHAITTLAIATQPKNSLAALIFNVKQGELVVKKVIFKRLVLIIHHHDRLQFVECCRDVLRVDLHRVVINRKDRVGMIRKSF
jgi:hypothetical protein